MDITARVTSKGQVTIPKDVREALGITEGDKVLFRLEASRAVLAKTANLLDLAGSVRVSASKRGVPWDQVRATTRKARGRKRR